MVEGRKRKTNGAQQAAKSRQSGEYGKILQGVDNPLFRQLVAELAEKGSTYSNQIPLKIPAVKRTYRRMSE